jgi:hypothetical protein
MTQTQVTKIAWYSIVLMILTSIHHVYGAIIYSTPWRLHVLIISIPVIALTLLLRWLLFKNESKYRWFLTGFFILITLVPSIGMIGIFEGLYNHVLKNIFFFSGASQNTLQSMFPAPKYEMPNDFIFELTGVLQGFIVVPMIVILTRLASSLVIGKQIV